MGLFVGSIRKKRYRAPLIHHLLKPRISGNTINGLGEARIRRPTPIYHWLDLRLPFKRVQSFFYWRDMRIAEFRMLLEEMYRGYQTPPAPVAEKKAEDTPEDWTRRVKEFALGKQAELVGVARMEPTWVFEGFEVTEPWIIVMGFRMDYAELSKAPDQPSNAEVLRVYNRGLWSAQALANWIRGQGWHARAFAGGLGSPVNMIPAAIAAGMGELGKHGSMINRKLGSMFRLATVVTEMPLVADKPERFGADEFCMSCRLCTSECPPQAIFESKQTVRGVERWYVDFDKCVPYFNDTFGCAICIAVCPWSRPNVAESLAEKMLSKMARVERQLSK
jgi:Pyruvate/2-oxoacid:ferredoxin oxidoreductase delta subunit